jgi:hypothetical protein
VQGAIAVTGVGGKGGGEGKVGVAHLAKVAMSKMDDNDVPLTTANANHHHPANRRAAPVLHFKHSYFERTGEYEPFEEVIV